MLRKSKENNSKAKRQLEPSFSLNKCKNFIIIFAALHTASSFLLGLIICSVKLIQNKSQTNQKCLTVSLFFITLPFFLDFLLSVPVICLCNCIQLFPIISRLICLLYTQSCLRFFVKSYHARSSLSPGH